MKNAVEGEISRMSIGEEMMDSMDKNILFDTYAMNHATLLILGIGSDKFRRAAYEDIRLRLHLATRSQLGLDGSGKLETVQHFLPELSNSGVSRLYAPTIEKTVGGFMRVFMNRWSKIILLSLLEEFPDQFPDLSDSWPWLSMGEHDVREELEAIVNGGKEEVLGKHGAIITSTCLKSGYLMVGTWLPAMEWLVFGRLKDAEAHSQFFKAVQGKKRDTTRQINLPEPLGSKVIIDVRRLEFETPLGTKGTRDRVVAFYPIKGAGSI